MEMTSSFCNFAFSSVTNTAISPGAALMTNLLCQGQEMHKIPNLDSEWEIRALLRATYLQLLCLPGRGLSSASIFTLK